MAARSAKTKALLDQPDGMKAWEGVRGVAESGIQIVYGGRTPSRDPIPRPKHLYTGDEAPRGIGIKLKPGMGFNKNREDGHDTWQGFMGVPIHKLMWRFLVNDPEMKLYEAGLRLPMMGMPPREPTAEMMKQARAGLPFHPASWFKHARVVPASYFAHPSNEADHTGTIPIDARCEFRTAQPLNDADHNPDVNMISRDLWFISLLPNELPSYHFWANSGDSPRKDSLLGGGLSPALKDESGNDLLNRKQTLAARSSLPPPSITQERVNSSSTREGGKARSKPLIVAGRRVRVAKSEPKKRCPVRPRKTAEKRAKE